jgi:hypothetical protein
MCFSTAKAENDFIKCAQWEFTEVAISLVCFLHQEKRARGSQIGERCSQEGINNVKVEKTA